MHPILRIEGMEQPLLPPFQPQSHPLLGSRHVACRTLLVAQIYCETRLPSTTHYYTDASHGPNKSLTAVVGPNYEHSNVYADIPCTAIEADTL